MGGMSIYKTLDIKSQIHDYNVLFVDDFSEELKKVSEKQVFFIIDKTVADFYKDRLGVIFQQNKCLIIEATESHKTLDYAKVVIRELIDSNFRKNNQLFAIGGGIIQDITGFVASILYRGVKWEFCPTTLLAQCDSCIGSKTSINVDEYKNQVGTFYPPNQIILDIRFLNTLPENDIKSGFGEIIKVHFLDGKESFKYIAEYYDRSLQDTQLISELIFKSLQIKKKIIANDEFDLGYRNIMNYGHTFGHAIESLTNYSIRHGQAVTIGMDISNYLSYKLGLLDENTYREMKKVVIKNLPKYNLRELGLDLFFEALSRDKKNVDNRVTMILTSGPGKMFKKSFGLDNTVKGYIKTYFEENY